MDPNLMDQRWTILTVKGPIPAVSGTQDTHIATPELVKRSVDLLNIYLDVGVTSRADAERMGIRIGDPIAPATTIMRRGATSRSSPPARAPEKGRRNMEKAGRSAGAVLPRQFFPKPWQKARKQSGPPGASRMRIPAEN